mgnify:CR=1 FL=1
MRYFKYKNTDKTVNNALKEQYKTVSDEEKRMIRKEKRWRKFSTIVQFPAGKICFKICIVVVFRDFCNVCYVICTYKTKAVIICNFIP